jgi:modification methylase
MPWTQYVTWQQSTLDACWHTLTDTGAIFYNHKPRVIGERVWLPTELNPGLPLRQIVIWARTGGINHTLTAYTPTHEWLLVLAKPAWRLKTQAASAIGDVWHIPQQANPDHPAPFPLALPLKALESVPAGVVLDPFMGVGTTGLACIRLGRPFIGIEIEKRFYDKACRAIEESYKQLDLYRPVYTTSPTQLTFA